LMSLPTGEADVLSATAGVTLLGLEYVGSVTQTQSESQSATSEAKAAAGPVSFSSETPTLKSFANVSFMVALVVCGIVVIGVVSVYGRFPAARGTKNAGGKQFLSLSALDAELQEESSSSRTDFMGDGMNGEIPNFA
jgi:hypothetical protein